MFLSECTVGIYLLYSTVHVNSLYSEIICFPSQCDSNFMCVISLHPGLGRSIGAWRIGTGRTATFCTWTLRGMSGIQTPAAPSLFNSVIFGWPFWGLLILRLSLVHEWNTQIKYYWQHSLLCTFVFKWFIWMILSRLKTVSIQPPWPFLYKTLCIYPASRVVPDSKGRFPWHIARRLGYCNGPAAVSHCQGTFQRQATWHVRCQGIHEHQVAWWAVTLECKYLTM